MFFGGEYWWANLVYLGLECLLAGGTERVSILNFGTPCLLARDSERAIAALMGRYVQFQLARPSSMTTGRVWQWHDTLATTLLFDNWETLTGWERHDG
jgi:hypothetical protein